MAQVELSIIIPTLNEAENLPLLIPQIAAAVGTRAYEVLVVDDNSRDDTPAVCAELGRQYPLRLIVRQTPRDGLSGAVLHGMRQASGDILMAMDADLQHPPEKIPELIDAIERDGADFVIGSRYVPGGTTQEKWGLARRINSRIATLLAAPFAGNTHDPMSGFFALRRETFESAVALTPLGYKIALELMCKCRVLEPGRGGIREIPIDFATRARGQSKLNLREQFRYLEHLSRLYDFTFPRASPVMKFLIVLVISWMVALGVYLGLLAMNVSPRMAPILAYPAALAVTALFHARYVRTQRDFLIRPPWRDFLMISLAEWTICALTSTWLAARIERLWAIEVFLIPFAAATIVRYILRKELLQDIRGLRRQ